MCLQPDAVTDEVNAMVKECHTKIVEFLVLFSKGHVKPGELNKKKEPVVIRQKPFGSPASQMSCDFKDVPPTWFAVTMATLYPLICEEKTTWDDRLKDDIQYPITHYWPVRVVKRYVHFANTWCDKISSVFKNYETGGGEYHGVYKSSESEGEEEEEESADCDDVF